jgi:DNA-binding transcriptional MocR family regulator
VAQTRTNLAWETLFDVSGQPSGPLHERLTRTIRAAIRDGRLPRDAALPPSRTGSATRVVWSPEPGQDRTASRSTPPRFDLRQFPPDYRAFPRRKWVEAVRAAYLPTSAPPALIQLALANFLESGAYDRHLRASRLRFRRRRDALVAALEHRLPGYPVRGTTAAHRRSLELSDPAELYFPPAPPQSWLPLGYANLDDTRVTEAVTVLAELLGGAASLSCAERGRKPPPNCTR